MKSLASQAAKATEQITAEINGVQAISGDVVRALDSIRHSVGTMRDHVISTAAAVEEQSAVTRDMSANMHSAASAVNTISTNVTSISAAVSQVNDAVGQTREAARVLRGKALSSGTQGGQRRVSAMPALVVAGTLRFARPRLLPQSQQFLRVSAAMAATV